MPNTPSSMLFRSTAINSMSNLPHDVIDAFIKQSCEAGMDVFTNFDAHNDPRNHKQVMQDRKTARMPLASDHCPTAACKNLVQKHARYAIIVL